MSDPNKFHNKKIGTKNFWPIFWIIVISTWCIGGYYGSKMISDIIKHIVPNQEYVNPTHLRKPQQAVGLFGIPDPGMTIHYCENHNVLFWAFDSLLTDSIALEKYCSMIDNFKYNLGISPQSCEL